MKSAASIGKGPGRRNAHFRISTGVRSFAIAEMKPGSATTCFMASRSLVSAAAGVPAGANRAAQM